MTDRVQIVTRGTRLKEGLALHNLTRVVVHKGVGSRNRPIMTLIINKIVTETSIKT
jgi:hypothetical protein